MEPWYVVEEPEEAAHALAGTVDRLHQNGTRHLDLLRWMSLYSNRDYTTLYSGEIGYGLGNMPRQILNTTQAIVDTIVSKHVLAESRAAFQVEEGDFIAHRKAEDMDMFVWGEFYRLGLFSLAELALRDALILGDGWLKFSDVDGRTHVERVSPLELELDPVATSGGPPTELYQIRYLPRPYMLRMWPEYEGVIARLSATSPPYYIPGSSGSDLLRVIEAWHLPSVNGRDGRHFLSCDGVLLNPQDTQWTADVFPFARISWSPSLVGGYAQGLVEQLSPLQAKLNELMKVIHDSIRLVGVPRIWQSAATKVTPEYNNRIGNVYKHAGPKPEVEVTQANHPEMYAQAERLESKMYALAGINLMEAQGHIPSRLDSRPALREHQDIASTRHAWVGKMWERLFIDCAKQIIRVSRDIVSRRGSYKAYGHAKEFVRQIDWKDIDLEDDRFVIKAVNVSLLPSTPVGKRLAIQELWQAGLFTSHQEAWAMMSGHPDVDALIGRKTAGKRLVEKQIFAIVKRDEYLPPDQYQDVPYAKQFALETYQSLLAEKNVPPKVLENLIQYVLDCDAILETQQMGAQELMQAAAAPAGASPSDVPVVPGNSPITDINSPIPGAIPPGAAPAQI